jgi:hypothetical protein
MSIALEDHSMKSAAYQLWLSYRLALYGVDNFILAPGVDRPVGD